MEVLGNAGIVYVLWNHCPNVPGAGRKAQYTAYPCGIFRLGGGHRAGWHGAGRKASEEPDETRGCVDGDPQG